MSYLIGIMAGGKVFPFFHKKYSTSLLLCRQRIQALSLGFESEN